MTPRSGRYLATRRGTDILELRLELPPAKNEGEPDGILSGDLIRAGGGMIAFLSPPFNSKRGVRVVDQGAICTVKADVRFGDHNYRTGTWGSAEIIFSSPKTGKIVLKAPAPANVDESLEITWKDSFFRDLEIEIDKATQTLFPKPITFNGEKWDLKRIFSNVGFKTRVTLSDRDVPNEPDGWTEGELNDAMRRFRRKTRKPWSSYVLVTSAYLYDTFKRRVDPNVLGLMFDWQEAASPDDPPREGSAIFASAIKDHIEEAFAGQPKSVLDREYLMTLAHEIGHSLNLTHSFEKGREDSASLMNYPQNYTYGEDRYYADCKLSFDTQELIHLRHHSRVVTEPGFLGGVTYGVGAFRRDDADQPVSVAPTRLRTRPALAKRWSERYSAKRMKNRQLLRGTLELKLAIENSKVLPGEPVIGEVTLSLPKREGAPGSVELISSLNWATRFLTVETRREPNGKWREHQAPIVHCIRPSRKRITNSSTISAELPIIMERGGAIFKRTGRYQVRVRVVVLYQGQDHVLYSLPQQVEVYVPSSRQERLTSRAMLDPSVRRFLVLRGGAATPDTLAAVRKIAATAPPASVPVQFLKLCLVEHEHARTHPSPPGIQVARQPTSLRAIAGEVGVDPGSAPAFVERGVRRIAALTKRSDRRTWEA